MYSLHRKKNGIYAIVCFVLILFLSPCPDQMVDRHREMISAALIIGGGRDTWMSISPGNTSTKNTIKQKLHNIIIVRNCNNIKNILRISSGQRRNGPPTGPGFSHVFFFLHSVTEGVLVPCRCRLWQNFMVSELDKRNRLFITLFIQ